MRPALPGAGGGSLENSEIHSLGPSELRLQARKFSGVERAKARFSFVFWLLWKSYAALKIKQTILDRFAKKWASQWCALTHYLNVGQCLPPAERCRRRSALKSAGW